MNSKMQRITPQKVNTVSVQINASTRVHWTQPHVELVSFLLWSFSRFATLGMAYSSTSTASAKSFYRAEI